MVAIAPTQTSSQNEPIIGAGILALLSFKTTAKHSAEKPTNNMKGRCLVFVKPKSGGLAMKSIVSPRNSGASGRLSPAIPKTSPDHGTPLCSRSRITSAMPPNTRATKNAVSRPKIA